MKIIFSKKKDHRKTLIHWYVFGLLSVQNTLELYITKIYILHIYITVQYTWMTEKPYIYKTGSPSTNSCLWIDRLLHWFCTDFLYLANLLLLCIYFHLLLLLLKPNTSKSLSGSEFPLFVFLRRMIILNVWHLVCKRNSTQKWTVRFKFVTQSENPAKKNLIYCFLHKTIIHNVKNVERSVKI